MDHRHLLSHLGALSRFAMPFCVLACGWLPLIGTARAAPPSAAGINCLRKLEGTPALTRDGKIRFVLFDKLAQRPPESSLSVVDVAPSDIDVPFFVCSSTRAPTGLLQATVLSVSIDGGPAYTGRDPRIQRAGTKFGFSFGYVRKNVLPWKRDFALASGTWLDRGKQFGLQRYQQVVGVRNRKIMPWATYLGAYYVGTTEKGRFLLISCVDFDVSKDVGCELQVQLQPQIMMTILVPTELLDKWPQYANAAERYFDSHLEH